MQRKGYAFSHRRRHVPLLHLLLLWSSLHWPCDARRNEGVASAHVVDGRLFQEPAVQAKKQSSNITVQVVVRAFWMRHGMSCANVIREFTHGGKFTQHSYADPSLTDCAIELAKALGDQLRPKIAAMYSGWQGGPLVFSSVLVRAMETALYNFPDGPVYPIPYIAEKDWFADNKPLSWIVQEKDKLARNPNTLNLTGRLKFVDDVNPANSQARNNREKSSYTAFKREFPYILSALLPFKGITAGTIVPVVLVSHSGYMQDKLKCRGSKPRNNEVWVRDYDATLAIPSAFEPAMGPMLPSLREVGNCGEAPLEQAAFPEYVGVKYNTGYHPCSLDIDRCSKTNPWMPKVAENATKCCPSIKIP